MMEESNLLTLNFDCSERILKFLDLESLCSVAETCTQLKTAAEIVFNSKYAKAKHRLSDVVQLTADYSKWQRVLENFAHLMQSVYLVECLTNLTATVLEKMQQKLPLMKDITFTNCRCMYVDVKKILAFCPNIERLQLSSSDFSTAETCELLALLSEKLKIVLCYGNEVTSNSECIDILCNFKHLKTLDIPFNTTDMTLLLNSLAAKEVPIEKLYLPCQLDDELIDSIAKFRIHKLAYGLHRPYHPNRLVQLAQRLPHLTELAIGISTTELDFKLFVLLQKIVALAENLTQIHFSLYADFQIDTVDYERLADIVKRRASAIKLKISVDRHRLTMNVHPDSLRRNEKYIEINDPLVYDMYC